jgi:hypothetical protein
MSRVLLIRLRPEESNQRIAAMKTSRRSECEVRQKGEPLGLRERGAKLRGVWTRELDRPKYSETELECALFGDLGGIPDAQVTLPGR